MLFEGLKLRLIFFFLAHHASALMCLTNCIKGVPYTTYLVYHKTMRIMKQLDVVVSPPAFVWNSYLTLTHVTFDLDPCDLWPWKNHVIVITFQAPNYNIFWNMNYCLRFLVQSRQTESNAYEPTVQIVQVGSSLNAKIWKYTQYTEADVEGEIN